MTEEQIKAQIDAHFEEWLVPYKKQFPNMDDRLKRIYERVFRDAWRIRHNFVPPTAAE